MSLLSPIVEGGVVETREAPPLPLLEEDFGSTDETERPIPKPINIEPINLTQKDIDNAVSQYGAVGSGSFLAENVVLKLQEKYGSNLVPSLAELNEGTAPIYEFLPEFQQKPVEERALNLGEVLDKFTNVRDFDFFSRILEMSPRAGSATLGLIYGAKTAAPIARQAMKGPIKNVPLAVTSVVGLPVLSAMLGEETAKTLSDVILGEKPPYNPRDRVRVAATDTLVYGLLGGFTPYSIGKKGINLGLGSILNRIKVGNDEISRVVPPSKGVGNALLRGFEEVTGRIGKTARERPIATALGEAGATGAAVLGRTIAETNYPEYRGLVSTTEIAAPAVGSAIARLSPTRLIGDFFRRLSQGVPEEVQRMREAGEGAEFGPLDYGLAALRVRSRKGEMGAAATILDELRSGTYSEKEIEALEEALGAGVFSEKAQEPTAEQLTPLFKNPILNSIRNTLKRIGADFDPAEKRVIELENNKVLNGINNILSENKELGYKFAVDFNQYLIETRMKKQLSDGVAKLTNAFKRLNPGSQNNRQYAELLVDRLRQLNKNFSDNAKNLYDEIPEHRILFDDSNSGLGFPITERLLRDRIKDFNMNPREDSNYNRSLNTLKSLIKEQKDLDSGNINEFELDYSKLKDLITDFTSVANSQRNEPDTRRRANGIKNALVDLVQMNRDLPRLDKEGAPVGDEVLAKLGAARSYYQAYQSVMEQGILKDFNRSERDRSGQTIDLFLKRFQLFQGDPIFTLVDDVNRVELFGVDPMGTLIPLKRGATRKLEDESERLKGILSDIIVTDKEPQSINAHVIGLLEANQKAVQPTGDDLIRPSFETPQGEKITAEGVVTYTPERLMALLKANKSEDGSKTKLFDLIPDTYERLRNIAIASDDAKQIQIDLGDEYKKIKKQQLWTVFAGDPESPNKQDFLELLSSGLSGRRGIDNKDALKSLLNPIKAMEKRIKKDPREFLSAIQENDLAPPGVLRNVSVEDLSDQEISNLNKEIVTNAKEGLKSLILDYAKNAAGQNTKSGIDFEDFSEILFQTDPNRNIKKEIRQVPLADFLTENGLATADELRNIRRSIEQLRKTFDADVSIMDEPGQVKRSAARVAGNIVFSNFVDRIRRFIPGIQSGGSEIQIGGIGAKLGETFLIEANVGKRLDSFLNLFSNPAKLGYLIRTMRQSEQEGAQSLTENAKEIARNILLEAKIAVSRRGLPAATRFVTEEVEEIPEEVSQVPDDRQSSVIPAAAVNKPPTTFAAAPLPVPPRQVAPAPVPLRQVAAVAPPPRPPLAGGPVDPARAAFAFGPQDMLARPALAAKGGAVNGGGIGTFFKQRG